MISTLSFRARLVVVALLVVAAGLGAAFVGVSGAMHARIMSTLSDHLSARAVEVLEAVRRAHRGAVDTLETWAATEAMGVTLDTGDPKFAEDYLLRTVNESPFCLVLLLDTAGRVVTAVRPASGEHGTAVAQLRGRTLDYLGPEGPATRLQVLPAVAPLLEHTTEGTTLIARVPVRDFLGDQQGLVVGVFSARPTQRLLRELGEEAASLPVSPMVIDRTGAVLFAGGLSGDRAAMERVLAAWEIDPQAPTGGITLEVRGERHLAYGARRPGTENPSWSAALLVREADALAPLVALRRSVALTFLLVMLVVAVSSVLAVRRAAEPLTRLVVSMDRVATGDLTARLPPERAEDLGKLVNAFNSMVEEVERSRVSLARVEGMRRELEIAHRIQASILPKQVELPGFLVAARSRPASEVGGDFYELIPTAGGFWILVGDVSGHGLNAGLIMLMVQAAAQAAVRGSATLTPAELFNRINQVVHENVRHRMGASDYVTMLVARFDGARFIVAGSHCPIVVKRLAGATEVLDVLGPWCGVSPDVSRTVTEFSFSVATGDVVLFFTDGLPEARDQAGALFGEERLVEQFAAAASTGPAATVDALFAAVDAHAKVQEDDMTAVVLLKA